MGIHRLLVQHTVLDWLQKLAAVHVLFAATLYQ